MDYGKEIEANEFVRFFSIKLYNFTIIFTSTPTKINFVNDVKICISS
jgi:hypothetical protein